MASKELTDLSIANTPQDIFANAGTAKQIQSTGFKVDIPDTVPSTSLVEGGTKSDVRNRRNQMESEQIAGQQFDADLGALTDRVGTPAKTPISDPEQFINRLLLNRPTDTQTALDTEKQGQAEATRGFADTLTETGEQAREQFALPELQTNLADTRTRIADRTVQLRQALRDFEVNAEQRGVARQFVQAEKQKIQADAAAELADLAIIESSQLGNLQQAQQDVDRLINEKVRAFELENAAIEQEISRLEDINTRESDVRSEQLQIALNERQRNEEKIIADEKQRLTYLSEAAANGADSSTLTAIRNASSPAEASLLASPFIGRLEREQAKINMAVQLEQLKKLRNPVAATRSTQVIDQDGQKMLVDTQTGEVITTFSNEQAQEVVTARDTAFVNNVDELKTHAGLNSSVGPIGIARAAIADIGGAKDEFIGSVENVVQQLTLNTFAEAKAKGMTFGAMSQGEWDILAQSATKISQWREKDDDGNVVGYDISEKAFKKELDAISNFGKMDALRKGAVPEEIGLQTMPDGTIWAQNSDGSFTQIEI